MSPSTELDLLFGWPPDCAPCPGSNAIVHRVELQRWEGSRCGADAGGAGGAGLATERSGGDYTTRLAPPLTRRDSTPTMLRRESMESAIDAGAPSTERKWDAAVKRPFSLAKMLAAMEAKAEAGVAKVRGEGAR